jgi:hypothetical protein
MQTKYNLSPFFPAEMPQEAQAREVQEFERMIYPVWMPIFDAGIKADTPEIEAVHKADYAIYQACVNGTVRYPLREAPKNVSQTRVRSKYQAAMA